MNPIEIWLEYWQRQLPIAERQAEHDQCAASRRIARECADNYRKWIAEAEKQLGYSKEAA